MRLVLNADDFGRSAQVNHAVERAHRQGILDGASLMIAGDAADEAVQIARRNPSLLVGLHLVVTDGPSVLGGKLPNWPVRLGLRYAISRQARHWLAADMAAQFERFAATGLPLAHVDGHQHMHMHPAVFELLLPLAERFGARRIRIVNDDLRLALQCDRRGVVGKVISSFIFRALAHHCRRCVEGSRFEVLERTYGFFQSGNMNEAYVLRVLEQINSGAEIYFHPTEGARLDKLGPNLTDLETLLSPRVGEKLKELEHIVPRRAVSTFLDNCDRHGDSGTPA